MFVATRRSWIVLASAMMLGSVGSPAQLLSISTSPAIDEARVTIVTSRPSCLLFFRKPATQLQVKAKNFHAIGIPYRGDQGGLKLSSASGR